MKNSVQATILPGWLRSPATLAASPLAAGPPQQSTTLENGLSPGWQPGSPREEIRPHFSFDPKGGPLVDGSLIITADGEKAQSGWWQKEAFRSSAASTTASMHSAVQNVNVRTSATPWCELSGRTTKASPCL